jgi:hypothetical protein
MLWNMTNIITLRSTWTLSTIAIFCASLMWFFPSMLLRRSRNDMKRVPVTPVTRITGITFVFTLKVGNICVLNYLYSENFSFPLLMLCLWPQIAMIVNICVLFIITDYNVWKPRNKIKTQSTIYLVPRQATYFNQTLSSSSCPQERKD